MTCEVPIKMYGEVWAVYYMHNSVSAGQSIEKKTARLHRRDWKGLLVSWKCDHLLFVSGLNSVPAPYFGGLQNLLFLGFPMITHKNLDPVIKINNMDCCVCSCCMFYCSVISSIRKSVKHKFYSWNHVLPNEKESVFRSWWILTLENLREFSKSTHNLEFIFLNMIVKYKYFLYLSIENLKWCYM
jgi:hypothetical protein